MAEKNTTEKLTIKAGEHNYRRGNLGLHFSTQLRLSLITALQSGVYKLQLTIILWSWEVNIVTGI